MIGYVGYPTATGQVETRQAIVSCPECTYLQDGNCVVCAGPDDHPACDGCRDGRVVWYRRPLFVSVVTAVAVSLAAGVIVKQVKKRTKLFAD
jgi:hypothetical protein